jgi:hypothetical protein
MYKLQLKRCIQSVYGWFDAGEFDSLDECVQALYDHYWLDARVHGFDEETYYVQEHEHIDEDGCEYVTFSFTRV